MSFTDPIDDLYAKSAKFRQEVAITGRMAVAPHIKHKATDWGKDLTPAETRRFLGGFDADRICPECHMTLSKSGACTGFCD